MNNDLISRDALKKDIDFQHICECCHDNGNVCDICPVAEIEKKIDEAPTIEEKSYAMGYQDGSEDGLQDIRPQGKWLGVVCENGGFYHGTCSICKVRNDIPPIAIAHFCPNCGADMRGKKHD